MKYDVPSGYHVIELKKRVPGVEAELFRWKWRANRRCKKLDAIRTPNYFRWEVHDWLDGRWGVVAMQNQIAPHSPET